MCVRFNGKGLVRKSYIKKISSVTRRVKKCSARTCIYELSTCLYRYLFVCLLVFDFVSLLTSVELLEKKKGDSKKHLTSKKKKDKVLTAVLNGPHRYFKKHRARAVRRNDACNVSSFALFCLSVCLFAFCVCVLSTLSQQRTRFVLQHCCFFFFFFCCCCCCYLFICSFLPSVFGVRGLWQSSHCYKN